MLVSANQSVLEDSSLPPRLNSRAIESPASQPKTVRKSETVSQAAPNEAELKDDKVTLSKEGKEESLKNESENDREVLSQAEQRQIQRLAERDAEVKAHERAHKSVAGQYAGAVSYQYQQGPDGKRYAVGGEVSIDVSPVSGDPEATIDKMVIVRAAALAPAEPSPQDRRVAALASQTIGQARVEQRELDNQERELEAQERDQRRDEANEAPLSDPLPVGGTLFATQTYSSVSQLESDNQNSSQQFVDDIA